MKGSVYQLQNIQPRIAVVIWTTTPWTLPANQAVAVHPQIDYALVEFDLGDGRERLPEELEVGRRLISRPVARLGRELEIRVWHQREPAAPLPQAGHAQTRNGSDSPMIRCPARIP